MTDEEILDHAARAREVLESPFFQEAFAAIDQTLLDKWDRTESSEHEFREDLWKMRKALQEIRRHFAGWVQHGKVVELTRAQTESAAKQEAASTRPGADPRI